MRPSAFALSMMVVASRSYSLIKPLPVGGVCCVCIIYKNRGIGRGEEGVLICGAIVGIGLF